MIDTALAAVALTSTPAIIEALRSDFVRLAKQHAARVVHEAVVNRGRGRLSFPKRGQ